MAATTFDYDLFVIGGGSGGVRAARIAARHGARVALAEESRVGGTCVIRGCVPKKLMVYAARYADDFEDAAGFGWTVGDVSFDWSRLIAAKDREIARLSAIYTRNLASAGVTLLDTRAELEDAHTLRLVGEDRLVTARYILIATGGRPNIDRRLPGAEHAVTSDEMFDLPEMPRRIAIVGASFVAIEFASILAGLGAETTLVFRGSELLRGFDGDIRTGMHAALEQRGIVMRGNTTFSRIDRTEAGLVGRVGGAEDVVADQILLAIGRSPYTRGLGLEKAGVALDPAGAVMVDAEMRTTVPSIYAVGDVTNKVNLTPVAIREGHAFADTVFGGRPTIVDHSNVPHAVFGTPEAGVVGLTEETAREEYDAVDIYKTSFTPMRNQLSGRAEKMLIKLVVDGRSDRLLGCHILGPDAAEMAQLMGVALKLRATKADLDATMALHPTMAEEIVTMREPAARYRRAAAE